MVVYILALTYGQHIETSFIVNKQNRSIPSLTFCFKKLLKKTYQLPLVGEYPDDVFKTSLSRK